jgi:hypothetical protein
MRSQVILILKAIPLPELLLIEDKNLSEEAEEMGEGCAFFPGETLTFYNSV